MKFIERHVDECLAAGEAKRSKFQLNKTTSNSTNANTTTANIKQSIPHLPYTMMTDVLSFSYPPPLVFRFLI